MANRNGRSSSPEAAAASRRNGAKSRGPRTEAGKRKTSQNALKHGLRSISVTPFVAGASWVDDLAARVCADLGVDPEAHAVLVEEYKKSAFLQRRAEEHFAERTRHLDAGLKISQPPDRTVAITLLQIRDKARAAIDASECLQKADSVIDAGFELRAAKARARSNSSGAILRDLQRLLHYERRFRAQRDRALRELMDAAARQAAQSHSVPAVVGSTKLGRISKSTIPKGHFQRCTSVSRSSSDQ